MDKTIQKKEVNDLSHLREEDTKMMGTDNVKREDLIIPRMKIVQENTKENHGVEKGNFIHSINGMNYGKKVLFVPVVHFKSNIKFGKGVMLCRSLDGKINQEGKSCLECGEFKFGAADATGKGKKPTCSRTFNYLIAVKEELQTAIETKSVLFPMILFFGGVSTKVGKLINTSIEMNASRKFPIYSQYFELTVPETERDFAVGKAFIPEVKVGNFVTPEEHAYLKEMFMEFSKLKVDISKTLDAEEEVSNEEEV